MFENAIFSQSQDQLVGLKKITLKEYEYIHGGRNRLEKSMLTNLTNPHMGKTSLT